MVSAIQSREFGFAVVVSEEQLKKVNEKRKKFQYKDLKAAVEAGGAKMALKSHLPFRPLYIPLNMGLTVMVIGTTTTWCCSWKTVWMY
jgi:hypothetical protein